MMPLRNSIIISLILSLTILSSCGFIRIDTSAAADQFTDFSSNEPRKPSEDLANDGHFGPYPQLPPADCGCVEKPKYNRPPCPMIYVPVCGCDGITYRNPCEARRSGIIKFTKGECQHYGPCYKIYAPVCGWNGVTYENDCIARRSGIFDYTKGKCRFKICPHIYAPVCGYNGITYGNECLARRAGITSFTKGKCHQYEFCPYIYAPVCGYNGITYSNECLARKAGIKYFRKGKCSTIYHSHPHDAIGL